MNFDFMNHALHALDDGIGRQPRNLRTYPSVPQADDPPPSPDGQHGRKTALSGAQHELSGEGSPAGPGTAGAGSSSRDKLVIDQQRQSIYGYERLIDKLYDLARADRFDELHDAIRAAYLAIHGPRD